MTQRRRHSLLETVVSTAVGFGISYWLSYLTLPLFGHRVSHSDNLWITVIFTFASLVRGYFLRRFFNWLNPLLTKDPK